MRKSKSEVEDGFGDLHFLGGGDDGDQVEDLFLHPPGIEADSVQRLPARQRLELRNEQRSLREQLSDWDDYDHEDFDTDL